MDCHKMSSDPLRYSIAVKYFNIKSTCTGMHIE